MLSRDSRFILDRVKDNIAPMVPVEGMNEWFASFSDGYFGHLKSTTFDPIIRRSAKIYAYWGLLDSMASVDMQESEDIESFKRSINNELAWSLTLTLEVMPDLNIDSGRLQTQFYFDLFKEILKNKALKINDIPQYFDEKTVAFNFSKDKNINDVEKRIFENLLFEVADKIFNVDAKVFLEISDALRSSQIESNEERYMATLSLVADSFFIQNILHQEEVSKSGRLGGSDDLLEYIFPRNLYWACIKNILEKIASNDLDAFNYEEEWLQSKDGDVIKLSFATPADQDRLHIFFEKVNSYRKSNLQAMPPLPNIYNPDNGDLLVKVASAYLESINDAFYGAGIEVSIPVGNGAYKQFTLDS